MFTKGCKDTQVLTQCHNVEVSITVLSITASAKVLVVKINTLFFPPNSKPLLFNTAVIRAAYMAVQHFGEFSETPGGGGAFPQRANKSQAGTWVQRRKP